MSALYVVAAPQSAGGDLPALSDETSPGPIEISTTGLSAGPLSMVAPLNAPTKADEPSPLPSNAPADSPSAAAIDPTVALMRGLRRERDEARARAEAAEAALAERDALLALREAEFEDRVAQWERRRLATERLSALGAHDPAALLTLHPEVIEAARGDLELDTALAQVKSRRPWAFAVSNVPAPETPRGEGSGAVPRGGERAPGGRSARSLAYSAVTLPVSSSSGSDERLARVAGVDPRYLRLALTLRAP